MYQLNSLLYSIESYVQLIPCERCYNLGRSYHDCNHHCSHSAHCHKHCIFARLSAPIRIQLWLGEKECKGVQVNVATCNCNCPGHLLCCDLSILNDYNYPIWQGKAPFCEGQCSGKCGSDIANCWWKSACGNGKRCWTGNEVMC